MGPWLIFLVDEDGNETPYAVYPHDPGYAMLYLSKRLGGQELLARTMGLYKGMIEEKRVKWEHGKLYEDYKEEEDEKQDLP